MEDHLLEASTRATGRNDQLIVDGGDRDVRLEADRVAPGSFRTLEWRQVVGGVLVLAGFVALIVGWWGVSGTDQQWKELPYLVSGGLGGIATIGVGLALFISFEHWRDREALRQVLHKLNDLDTFVRFNDTASNSSNGQGKSSASRTSSRRAAAARNSGQV